MGLVVLKKSRPQGANNTLGMGKAGDKQRKTEKKSGETNTGMHCHNNNDFLH